MGIAAALTGCIQAADDSNPCAWRCAPIAIRPNQPASSVIGEADLNTRVAADTLSATAVVPFGNPAVTLNYVFVADATTGRIMAFPVTGLVSGEAASFVLGAPSPTSPTGLNMTAADFSAGGVATDNVHLAVVDQAWNRVLIYNSIPTSNYAPADVEVGQPSMTTGVPINQYGCDQSHFLAVNSASLGGGKLVVTDTSNNRVLIWNSIPTVNGQPADVVIGQPDFMSCSANMGLPTPTANTLNFPWDAWTDGTNLVVSDQGNNRVLMWHGMPAVNGQPADTVLGQADFVSNTVPTAVAGNTFAFPEGISADPSSLYVTDTGDSRVMVFPLPGLNTINPSATFALGQTALNLSGSPTTPTANSLSFNVTGVAAAGGVLYVNDAGDARVLTFATPITTNGPAAANVLGQGTSFTTGSGSSAMFSVTPTATGITPGLSAVQIGGYLFVPDLGVAQRVMQYTLPGSGAATLAFVQGVTSTSAWNNEVIGLTTGAALTATDFAANAVATDGTQLLVADPAGNRILIFPTAPAANYAAATYVVGATSLTTQGFGCTQTTFAGLQGGIAVGGGKLVAADAIGNRVLIWNTIPSSNGQAADLVLGQADFTHCTPNHGGTDQLARLTANADSFRFPWNVWTDGNKLLVADEANNRVLGWNTFPTVNGQPADFALGQPDLNSRDPLIPPTQATLRHPFGVTSNGVQIVVADTSNNRVMLWSAFPGSSGLPADSWLGQADPDHAPAGTSPTGMASPEGVAIINNQVWVMDTSNYRILVFTDQFH